MRQILSHKELITDKNGEIARWAASRIPYVGKRGWGPCTAVGWADAETGKKLLAAIVYHDYNSTARTMAISIASTTPRWASRGVIRASLVYPFHNMLVNKLWVAIPMSNPHAIDFVKRIGFKAEAVLAHHCGPDQHMQILRMLRSDWAKGKFHYGVCNKQRRGQHSERARYADDDKCANPVK